MDVQYMYYLLWNGLNNKIPFKGYFWQMDDMNR